MASSPKTPQHAPKGRAARANIRFAARSTDQLVAPARRRVRTHSAGQVVVLEVDGLLSEVVADLDHGIRLALAEGPRGVVCDLSAVLDDGAPGAMRVLATAGRHVRDWPGIPVAVAYPDEQMANNLRGKPLGEHLLVTGSLRQALSAILDRQPPVGASLRITPYPGAPRAAQDFLSRTLLDWGLGQAIPTACLLVSEIVSNAMVDSGTDFDVSVATHLQALRVTVRDYRPGPPPAEQAQSDRNGPGVALVADLSRAWGVLPTAERGKMAWAVFDAHPDQAAPQIAQ